MLQESILAYLNKYGFEHLRLKAVLFDMDGVLFNSMPYHAKAWKEAVSKFGLFMTHEEVYEHEGRTGSSTINILSKRIWNREATEQEIQDIYAEKSRIFNSYPEAERMPGAYELLNQVKAAGIQPVLVTGSGQLSLLDRLNRQFPNVFHPDVMVTSFDVIHGKPNPEPYLKGLQKANVKPWEALVVENAPMGIKAGVSAQIFTIAVNTGPLPNERLASEGANLLFPSMVQLSKEWPHLLATMG